MPMYHLTWEIDLDADTPLDAARLAMHYLNKPGTSATIFMVQQHDAPEPVKIDLTEIDEENGDMQRALAVGWHLLYAGDPETDRDTRVRGPVLYHAETDRVWPPSDPAGAVTDLGYYDDDFCRTCNALYDGHGDGYDGECPDCADKTEAQRLEAEVRGEMRDLGWRRATQQERDLGFMPFQHEDGTQDDSPSWEALRDADPLNQF